MADDKPFAAGLIYKRPHERAPEFVKAEISIKVEEFVPFLEAHAKPDGWVNLQVKESRGGKLYVQLNHYTADKSRSAPTLSTGPGIDYPKDDINPEDVPF